MTGVESKMKITNPYSKNRFTKTERIDRKITTILKPLLKKYIDNIEIGTLDYEKHPKYIIKSFHKVAYNMKQHEEYKKKKEKEGEDARGLNAKPLDIDIKLNCIFMSELIIVENLNDFKKGIKKIFEKINKNAGFFTYYDPENVNSFCDSVEQNLNGEIWSNLGYLEISESHKLYEFAKYIEVYVTHISSSFIILGLNVYPSEKFLEIFNDKLETNYPPDDVIKIRPKKFTHFWNHTTYSETSKKEIEIEDLKLELKWKVLKFFNQYFELYLSTQSMIVPSIESYELTKDRSNLEGFREGYNETNFFSSLKMKRGFERELSKDGYWEIYYSNYRYSADLSLKVTCNSMFQKKQMFQDLESEIISRINEYGKLILPVLIINSYLKNLSKKLAKERQLIFRFLNKNKNRHKEIINTRFKLEKEIQVLKRLKNEFNNAKFESIAKRVANEIGEFDRPDFKMKVSNSEIIIDNTNSMLETVYKYASDFARTLDDRIELLEIQTNNSIRKSSFTVTIISAFITLLAMIIAALSLYVSIMGLDVNKKNEILEFLNEIVSILF